MGMFLLTLGVALLMMVLTPDSAVDMFWEPVVKPELMTFRTGMLLFCHTKDYSWKGA